MKKYYKKINCGNWARIFTRTYSIPGLDAKILVHQKGCIHLYAGSFMSGGKDLSDLPGTKIYTHGRIRENALSEEAGKQGTEKIVLLLETGGYVLELVRNSKGDVICAYDSEEELELAEKTLALAADTIP